MATHSARTLKLRIKLCAFAALGPGKADLLEAVDRCGSISAAARDQGMSYRRAWLLIDEMNRALTAPVLDTAVSGATLTAMGRQVVDLYRRVETKAAAAVAAELDELSRLVAEAPQPAAEGCTGRRGKGKRP
ncbi:MAG: LysR family transcriptional regulator [Magnetospirillum sp.]|nr:LysR family transcriptional regulator [Magnetospirillum sp.]